MKCHINVIDLPIQSKDLKVMVFIVFLILARGNDVYHFLILA